MFTWNDHHIIQTDLWFYSEWRGTGSSTALSYHTFRFIQMCYSSMNDYCMCVLTLLCGTQPWRNFEWTRSSLSAEKPRLLSEWWYSRWITVFQLFSFLFSNGPMFNQALVQSIICHMFKFCRTPPQVWQPVLNWQARCCTLPFKYSISYEFNECLFFKFHIPSLRDACLWAICVLYQGRMSRISVLLLSKQACY